MGSWDETCFQSNFPISDGDPAVIFITVTGGWGDDKHRPRVSHHYPRDAEDPVTLPIRGTYNSYGSIEFWDDKSVAVLLAEELFKAPLEETISRIYDHMRKDYGLSIKSIHGADNPVSMLMMHGRIYDRLVADYTPLLRPMPKRDLHRHFERKERLSKLSDKRKNGTITKEEKIELDSELNALLIQAYDIDTGMDQITFSSVRTSHSLEKVWLATPEENREALVAEYEKLRQEHRALDSSMVTLRKAYGVGSGAGSQNCDLDAAIEFADIVKETAVELKAKWDEEE